MILRPAESTDAASIAAIWNPLICDTAVTFNASERSEGELAGMIAARRRDGHAFIVAEGAGGLLGFATYAQFRGGVGYARTMEHTVILADRARGQGIGRGLMQAIEAHAAARGVHSMIAGVSGENPAGIAFHRALGYRTVAVLPSVGFKFGRFMDLHLMQKFLTPAHATSEKG